MLKPEYVVTEYDGDGCTIADPRTFGPFDSIDEARAHVRSLLGGRTFGTWFPPQECFPGDVEGWHNSADENCGGWMISQPVS